jgi:hypothetical protein
MGLCIGMCFEGLSAFEGMDTVMFNTSTVRKSIFWPVCSWHLTITVSAVWPIDELGVLLPSLVPHLPCTSSFRSS